MKKNRVLIVEDDREMCDELAEILSMEGYSVDKAYEGKEGKRLVDSFDYAVVLLDLRLPGFNGSELLRHVKGNCASRVLVITGKPLKSELREYLRPKEEEDFAALELADGIAEKPFEVEAVIESVRKLSLRTTPKRAPRTSD